MRRPVPLLIVLAPAGAPPGFHAASATPALVVGAAAGRSSAAHAGVASAQDWQRDHGDVAAFVQARRGRAILGSAAVPLKNARP